MTREYIVNRTLNPLLTDLPPQFLSFRSHQIPAIGEAARMLRNGTRVVLVNAPTGSGKTLIGEALRRMMKARAVYVCHNKELQRQFDREFPYARLLMGRSNYPTLNFKDSFHPGDWIGHISAEDCTWNGEDSACLLCPEKRRCPYEVAKSAALESPVAILNTAYFLTECNGPGRFRKRGLVIADEADLLEDALMGFVSVEVSKKRMQKYGWEAPKLTVEDDWLRWCRDVLPDVKRMRGELSAQREVSVAESRELKYLTGLATNLTRVVKDLESGTSAWVYDGDREYVSFKPSRVVQYGEEKLWQHGKQWVLMSASIVSPGDLMWSLGFKEGEYGVVDVPSTFPVKNRLVHVRPVADMTFKAGGKDDGALMAALRRIVFQHPNDRVLVHSVSYALTDKLVRRLRSLFPGRPIFCYTNANSRSAAIECYRRDSRAVLLGPSLDRGIDLPGDLCRVQVIVKTPFPNLKDKVVNARYHSGQEGKTWYTVKTVRSLIQMTGRAIRSEDDWAETYILDKAFVDRLWYKGGKSLFPQWWQEALVWDRV